MGSVFTGEVQSQFCFDLDTPVIELSKLIVPLLQKQPGVPFICLDAQYSEVVTLVCE